MSTIIEVHKLMPARDLLEILNDPNKQQELKSLGWDVDAIRQECEAAITSLPSETAAKSSDAPPSPSDMSSTAQESGS